MNPQVQIKLTSDRNLNLDALMIMGLAERKNGYDVTSNKFVQCCNEIYQISSKGDTHRQSKLHWLLKDLMQINNVDWIETLQYV